MEKDAFVVYRDSCLTCDVRHKPVAVFETEEQALRAAARLEKARRRDQCGDCNFEVVRVRAV